MLSELVKLKDFPKGTDPVQTYVQGAGVFRVMREFRVLGFRVQDLWFKA